MGIYLSLIMLHNHSRYGHVALAVWQAGMTCMGILHQNCNRGGTLGSRATRKIMMKVRAEENLL